MSVRRPWFGRDYVRVTFKGRQYTYFCPGCRVGEQILVPPKPGFEFNGERTVKVVALGRRYFGPIKSARKLDTVAPDASQIDCGAIVEAATFRRVGSDKEQI